MCLFEIFWKSLLIPRCHFSQPFSILQLVKSLPFYIPPAWKRYPFRAKPPRIVHYWDLPRGLNRPLSFWKALKKVESLSNGSCIKFKLVQALALLPYIRALLFLFCQRRWTASSNQLLLTFARQWFKRAFRELSISQNCSLSVRKQNERQVVPLLWIGHVRYVWPRREGNGSNIPSRG